MPRKIVTETITEEPGVRQANTEQEPAVRGGPGQDIQPSTADLVDYKIGDKTFKLPKDSVEALAARDSSFEERFRQYDTKIAEIAVQRNVPGHIREESPQRQEPDWGAMLFTDTNKALELYGQKIKDSVKQELTQRYTAERDFQRFWTDFYKKNEDLVGSEFLVEAVMNKNLADLSDLNVEKARDKLADLSRAAILTIKGENPGDQTEGNRTRIESGNTQASGGKKGSEPETPKVTSLGDVIRLRAAARAKSGNKRAS